MKTIDNAIIDKANDLLKSNNPEHGIELLQQYIPPNHHYMAIAYNALAAKQYQQQDWKAAKLSLEHVKIIWQENRPNSLELAACENNLGRVCENLELILEATDCHLRAYQIRLQILGTDHSDTGDSLLALGAVYLMQDKPKKSLEYLEKAADLFNTIKGTDSSEYRACQANIQLAKDIINNKNV